MAIYDLTRVSIRHLLKPQIRYVYLRNTCSICWKRLSIYPANGCFMSCIKDNRGYLMHTKCYLDIMCKENDEKINFIIRRQS